MRKIGSEIPHFKGLHLAEYNFFPPIINLRKKKKKKSRNQPNKNKSG